MAASIRRWLLGQPRRLKDRAVFHSIALIPILAWVGLGGDGLSSSAYGPDEAYRALGSHGYLALPLALAVGLTVLLISACYMRVIERFPGGGGGYVVASSLLGPRIGVTAACALLVDYVLTVSVSIAAGADALFSLFAHFSPELKIGASLLAVLALVILNMRGAKESITVLAPIFALFLLTHAAMLVLGLVGNVAHAKTTLLVARAQAHQDTLHLGWLGLLAILARAYSMGAGTFTGIEAVSNGLPALREPRIKNGKRTMVYMALSLAAMAGGMLLCYQVVGVTPTLGKTLNAVLAEKIFGNSSFGRMLAGITLAAEGALLFVAAQTGFMDGPRVMANMAADRWVPRRFANLSDRLITQNGVLLMGASAGLILWLTHGDTHALVVMYSINVFLVFSLTTVSMARAAYREGNLRHLLLQSTGFVICTGILAVTLVEKFASGGWLTLTVTGALVVLCLTIRKHYDNVAREVRSLDKLCALAELAPAQSPVTYDRLDAGKPTAIILVGDFGGLGIHTMAHVLRSFPGYFAQIVFVGVALVDAHTLKNDEAVKRCAMKTRGGLQRYVHLARRRGLAASYEMTVGTEVVSAVVPLCAALAVRFAQSVSFGGNVTFTPERWYHRVLHNENATGIQRRLQEYGVPMLIMPIRFSSSLATKDP